MNTYVYVAEGINRITSYSRRIDRRSYVIEAAFKGFSLHRHDGLFGYSRLAGRSPITARGQEGGYARWTRVRMMNEKFLE